MSTLYSRLTAALTDPPTYNVGMAETYSWIPIEGASRPLFARASYIVNPDDLNYNSFVIPPFDNIAITNDGSGNPLQYDYSKNGTIVATLSCTYDGSGYLTNIQQIL
jgi:hypothetical protein